MALNANGMTQAEAREFLDLGLSQADLDALTAQEIQEWRLDERSLLERLLARAKLKQEALEEQVSERKGEVQDLTAMARFYERNQ